MVWAIKIIAALRADQIDVDQGSFSFMAYLLGCRPYEMASIEEVAHDYSRKPSPENAGTSDHWERCTSDPNCPRSEIRVVNSY